jgi:nucleotide-binding universal stress UspA family protein
MDPVEDVIARPVGGQVDSFDGPPAMLPVRVAPLPGLLPERSSGEGIVVGVDGTRASIGALRQGAQLARSLHLPLLAICATDSGLSSSSNAASMLMRASHQVFGSTPPDWFQASAQAGTPAAVLGRASEHARMLFIGHSISSDSDTARASVSSTIAARVACPIVIFHPTHAWTPESFDAAGA